MRSILKEQIDLRQTAHDPCAYTISWHVDWALGATIHGGTVVAAIHHAAVTHLATHPTLVAKDQPDVLKLHAEFFYPCERRESTIKITTLRTGSATCTLELRLFQDGTLKVLALATSTNFDKPLGPTVPSAWTFRPQPKPVPNFNNWPDPNWLPARFYGTVLGFTGRILVLNPRGGHPVPGICDGWYGFLNGERMDETYLALMTDVIPSMSDTLMRNGGLYDAHAAFNKMEDWARAQPDKPAEINNSIEEAIKATKYNATVTLDVEFKRRLPAEGLEWVFTRVEAKMLQGGRMGVDITMCNEKMELVATAQQLILVLPAYKKFTSQTKAAL